jgi:hypothetical protein
MAENLILVRPLCSYERDWPKGQGGPASVVEAAVLADVLEIRVLDYRR